MHGGHPTDFHELQEARAQEYRAAMLEAQRRNAQMDMRVQVEQRAIQ